MPESQNIEYKESWRDEYLKWVCGFANAQGGAIYIGIRDDGTVAGVADGKQLLEDIPNKWAKAHPEIPIEGYDERFTSVMAHQTMLNAGLHKKARLDKALVDRISATIILQSYLSSKRI